MIFAFSSAQIRDRKTAGQREIKTVQALTIPGFPKKRFAAGGGVCVSRGLVLTSRVLQSSGVEWIGSPASKQNKDKAYERHR
jgi:hypothetical protein